ncbi:hypothetical protein Ais01nite_03250 [Asanoa ishikariensis]|uniref:LPXTG-motif cell wall anchor domain-containing protein n=1 Tax=Asanoa ishikariensis TaxID=137265 RepID=A0A1H3TJJ2_9ACTN|nr:hypothetical protein [Asanoa ishikariensis]GIF62290.1 hypothetical protein Ais01nite_03250 [Asanoa ishikariensis]SDZ50492.1 hypothetical protein SAMN05421684_5905 [Asanoa ishikariensis]
MISLSTRALMTLSVLSAAAVGATLAPGRASAHPFGDPQTVAISLDADRGDLVHVTWRVGGPDDLTVLGVSLGVLPEDRILTDGAVDYRYTDPGVLGKSEQFRRYLLDRITITNDGQPCVGSVEPILALGLKGATADYICAQPVTTATVAVRMLTDLNPAYRTLATGPSGQKSVYDGSADTHDWTLVGAPPLAEADRGRSAVLQLAAVIGLILVVAAGYLLTVRRLRRRKVAA